MSLVKVGGHNRCPSKKHQNRCFCLDHTFVASECLYVCIGLGKTLSGRVEPVQAMVLPKGRSLDICAELTQRKTAAAIAKNNPASHKPKAKRRKRKASTSTRHNVFDFLNSKLGDGAQPASHSSSSSITGAEAYRGGKSTKRSLNVRLFQATEKVAQVEREIQQLTKSLSKRNGRYAFIIFSFYLSISSPFLTRYYSYQCCGSSKLADTVHFLISIEQIIYF